MSDTKFVCESCDQPFNNGVIIMNHVYCVNCSLTGKVINQAMTAAKKEMGK